MTGPKKRLYIKTYGCQMNVYDSELMAQVLSADYTLTTQPEDADLYLINTCSIRAKSEEKVHSLLGRLRFLKKRRPQMLIGVGGCVAQQEGERLRQRVPHLDLVFGTHGIYRLPEMLRQVEDGGAPVVDTDYVEQFQIPPRRHWPPGQGKALVTIMQGCNNFCTYCVVPYVRGPEMSRPSGEIIQEVQNFLASGGREVTLLGQNVNSYGRGCPESLSFPQLLRELAALPGLARLRFTTSHPRDLSAELIQCFAELPALCEHIHLPVQSGSSRILSRMKRGYNRDDYLQRVRQLQAVCPEIAITTDLIVGFPGETEEDFQETLSLMQEVPFDNAFYFKYSPRPQTRAATFPGQIAESIKAARLARLKEIQDRLTRASHQRLVGQIKEVLVEGRSKQSTSQLSGRLRSNQVVNFTGSQELIGRLVQVRIEQACQHSLGGRALGCAGSC
ncbi:MAG: tRNA (N6-isopentenyl adenosine(37)-C2)-methylthiotransferase MiaB [Desulfobacca sp. 4484_104]|nr:MAG: tRNA (N6-isopentenyl adenosine(37)-C2)-methylthiotransferase MiaB [Desulfobacca sp. 4484_104]RLA89605.1 MAG: tRNA (N6-isopentenyl adenosine(37)-C2)-methylthiotransferase MiaB [Deltaproteobacteria bacterium]